MGLLFRKSFKIAPGIKFNLGKKSAGISVGGKNGGISFNTKTGARGRVSIPGTGLSYEFTPKKGKKEKYKEKKHYVKNAAYDIRVLERELEILNNCAELMQTTSNPETFFYRYDLYIQKLSLLSNAEHDGVHFEGDSPTKKLSEVTREHEKMELVNGMIDRCWNKTLAKINTLKTESAKENQVVKFKESLSAFNSLMPKSSIYYYQSKSV